MNKKRLLVVSFIFWLPVLLFSYLAGEILERQPILLDNAILHWIHAHSTGFLDGFLLLMTNIGGAAIIAPLALVICAVLWWQKLRQSAAIVFVSFFGAAAANFVLKLIFHRSRPAFWQSAVHETGYSFPSGHAMMSSALIFSLVAVTWHTRWRWYVIALGAVFVASVGYSRLYLGVHYPTDIMAGWLASAAWVFAVTVAATNQNLLLFVRKRLCNEKEYTNG